MPSTRQRGFLYQRFFTLKRQPAVGNLTGLPDGCDKSVALKGYSPGKLAIKRETMSDPYGAGREFPWRADDGRIDSSLSDNYDLTALVAAYIAGFAFGNVATTGVGAPYTHTFKVQSGIDLPVTSVIDKVPGGHVMYHDLALGDFSISGQGAAEQMIALKAGWKGSGRYDDDAGTFSGYTAPALTQSSYFRMGGLDFALGTFGAESNSFTPAIERFDYSFSNNPFDGHRPGSGLVAGWAEAGARRTHGLTFEALRDSADTLMGHYKSKTLLSAIITLKADDHATSGQEVKIIIPQLEIVKCDPTGGESQAVSVETAILFDSARTGYDAANQSPVVIVVKNAEAAHLQTLS